MIIETIVEIFINMSNVVGCLFICKKNNNFLLLRRSNKDPKDYYRGYWSLLTGHMDEDELPYQSMDRETSEEIGIEKNTFNFIKYKVYKTYKNNNFHFYYCLVPEEFTPNLNEENMDYMWCNFYELPKPLYPGSEKIIETLLTFI